MSKFTIIVDNISLFIINGAVLISWQRKKQIVTTIYAIEERKQINTEIKSKLLTIFYVNQIWIPLCILQLSY